MSKINFTTVVIPDEIKAQLKKEVLEAFPSVTVTVNNLNIWVSGDTKPIKDELKAFGFKWAAKRKAWFMRIPDTAKPYEGYQPEAEAEAEPEESEQMKAIRAMLAEYKAGNISFDEYMTKQKEICAECSARCAVKVAGATSPANACPIADRPQKQIAGYLPAPKPELTEEQQKLVDYYRKYAKHLTCFVGCENIVRNLLKVWQKPINKTFVDKVLEALNGYTESEEMGHVYASWNCYNPKQLNVNYYPKKSGYTIASLSLLVESKTQKLTDEQKEVLINSIDGQVKYHAERAARYESMADSYSEYLEAKKQRDNAILEANEAFNANKTFAECESDAKYNSSYGKYNYRF